MKTNTNKIQFKKYICILLAIALCFLSGITKFSAFDIPKSENLSAKEKQFISSYFAIARDSGFEYSAQNAVALYNEGKRYTQQEVLNAVNAIIKYSNDEAANNALIVAFSNAGISINTSSSQPNNNAASKPVPKTEFTVTDVTPYSAWATKDCNIRSGADTTYDKVGSLKQYEQVTVTGQASTGWFRITTSNGTEAYVSNTLLTTEDPTKVTFSTVTEEGAITEHTVENEDPEVVAQVVEQIKEEADAVEEEKAHEHTYTSEITKEATCTEKGVITYTCADNDDSYTEEIPMLEHEAGEWVIDKEPSLISKGNKVQYCLVGGEIFAEEEIPAKTGQLIAIIIGCAAVICGAIVGIITFRKKR